MNQFLDTTGIRFSAAQDARGGSVTPAEVLPHLLDLYQRLTACGTEPSRDDPAGGEKTQPPKEQTTPQNAPGSTNST